MAAYDTGKMILFVRSILWDLEIPQEAATILYEDNDACTAMGNAQKPTPRTRHMDIKYFSLCEWVDRDLMHLERIDTSISMSDHCTKLLNRALFHRHADFLLGHVPPMYSPVTSQLLACILTTFGHSNSLFRKHLPPPRVQPRHGFMLPFQMTMLGTRGSQLSFIAWLVQSIMTTSLRIVGGCYNSR